MNASGRTLFIDGSAGAAGDMILGALVGLGVPLAHLRRGLQGLPLPGWSLRSRKLECRGLAARKVDVRVREQTRGRGWAALRKIVRGGGLPAAVRDRSLAIFRRLIEAEAEAHGVAPDEVHLHEAGGTDAIVDIVGASIGLDHLKLDRIVVSPLTTGYGSVRCAHGLYPVPAPATLLLTRGVPIRAGSVEGERLTPTGAAVLTGVADAWSELPPLRPLAVGYGAGDRDFGDTPNLLRMVLGDACLMAPRPGDAAGSAVVVVECNVDDCPPQTLAYAMRRVLQAGALDAFTAATTMKKGRSGHLLTVLCGEAQVEAVARLLFEETSTLGLRYRAERRIELDRSTRRVRTRFGGVGVKIGTLEGRVVQAWPEFADCEALAERHGVALKTVQQAALEAFHAAGGRPAAGAASRRRRGKA